MVKFTAPDDPIVNIEWRRDIEPVYSLSPMPDPNWRQTCPCGVVHRWVDGKYPSLVEVFHDVFHEGYWCDSCCDEHASWNEHVTDYWYCGTCSTVITPGTTTMTVRPGLEEVKVTARYYIDEATFEVTYLPSPREIEAARGNPYEFFGEVVGRAFVHWYDNHDDPVTRPEGVEGYCTVTTTFANF
jgi:hypothetical protein